MPWNETCAMDERVRFIGRWLEGRLNKRQLCAAFGVSRVTGDKWLRRYEAEGLSGLAERSRAPHGHPNAVAPAVVERIVAAKLGHPHWGPKKVMDWLRRRAPDGPWPADSTAGVILERAGLVRARRRRRRVAPMMQPLAHCGGCHEVWSADFKGDYRLGDGRRCYPLTVTDNHSRYLLVCRALARPTHAATRPWFEWVFRTHGLPAAIRTDNGAPFASLALGGLSRLSAWWVRLGIRPERIAPGRPSQNGRHERMHRPLKAEATQPPSADLAAQQRRFDAFVDEYNHERSHEGLGRTTPASHYAPSPRPYPEFPRPLEYDLGQRVRRVRSNGEIKWAGGLTYVSVVLAGEPVGLEEFDTGLWEVRYSFHPLGVLDERTGRITSAPGSRAAPSCKPCARSET